MRDFFSPTPTHSPLAPGCCTWMPSWVLPQSSQVLVDPICGWTLGSWQLGSWLPHSPVGVLVLTECICTSQKCEKQTAKMKRSSCLLGISEHGSHDAWSPVERRMGEKPVAPPLPACLVGKYNPEGRGQREGLRGSATVAPGRSISKSVEAPLCPVSCNAPS